MYFIQGLVLSPKREENEGWQASSVIQRKLLKAFATIEHDVYFLPFRKHLVFTLKIPKGISAPCYWEDGEKTIVELIDRLKHQYGIQLYIGVGSIHRELSGLKKVLSRSKNGSQESPPDIDYPYAISMKYQRIYLYKRA
ncbi:hypothetical protein RCO48_18525 [Peribacillus frigoritolerans]|nr:hypothetical protein [Peribacillus frigoritolerans]